MRREEGVSKLIVDILFCLGVWFWVVEPRVFRIFGWAEDRVFVRVRRIPGIAKEIWRGVNLHRASRVGGVP